MRNKTVPLLLPLLPAALLLAFFVRPALGDLSGDSARYLLLGRALAQGRGYVELEKPDAPPHTEYGPGLPALIAPGLALTHSALPAKLIVAACWIAAVALVAFIARDRLALSPGRLYLIVPLICALLPAPARFANQVLSDLPYCAASLAAVLLVTRLIDRADQRPSRFALAGAIIAAAFLFRQTALALLAGCATAVMFDSRRSRRGRAVALVALAAGFIVPAGAWLLRNYLVAGSLDPAHAAKLFSRDGDPFSGSLSLADVALRLPQGLAAYFRESGGLLLDMAAPIVPRSFRLAASVFLVLPALAGLFASLRKRRERPLEWHLIFYLVLVSLWQSHNPRYLIPLLPLIIILWLEGVWRLAAWARLDELLTARTLAATMIGLCVSMMVTDMVLVDTAPVTPMRGRDGAYLTADGEDLRKYGGEIDWGRWYQYPDFLRATDPRAPMIRYHRLIAAGRRMSELPETTLVVTRKPPLVAWLSGRHAIQYPPEPDPDRFLAALESAGATHLLLDETSGDVRGPFERVRAARPDRFLTLYHFGGTEVIELQGVRANNSH